jgi:hypothetical protein
MNADTPRSTPEPTGASPRGDRDARRLEARLVRLENYLGFRPLTDADAEIILARDPSPSAPLRSPAEAADEGLEMDIGEFWLARIGVVALIVGLGFLVAYPFPALPAAVPSLIGFGAFGALWWASERWQKSLPAISHFMFWGALILGFFATVRLHFFSTAPLLGSASVTLGLLVAVLAGEYWIALRRGCQRTAALVAILGFVTAVASNSMPIALALMTGVVGFSVWLLRSREWLWHYTLAGLLTFLLHLDLLMGNPLGGHPLRAAAESQGNLFALAAYALLLAAPVFFSGAMEKSPWLRVLRPLVLSGGVMLVAGFNVLLFHRGGWPWIELLVAAGFLGGAMAAWWHQSSRYATAVFACAGYVTLSAFLVRLFPAPDFYGWLAWQSLLVAGTAVWFRSKIIVVANVFIFALIYGVYLLFAHASGPVNLSFAIVALLTARLLNWQKSRLDLHTELMRNFYLGAATVAVPYGLYHTVPPGWVSTSWLVAAGAYFGVSVWLKNKKYRWMAMGTVLATIVYVFVVDLSRLAPAYRILSFLVLGVALLAISIFYGRSRKTKSEST